MESVILNSGDAAWVFEEHANRLSKALGVSVASSPARFNYVLGWDQPEPPPGHSFIPFESVELASDKRHMAQVFEQQGVATPRTYLLDSQLEVQRLLEREDGSRWVLKWPTGCGATGHRMIEAGVPLLLDWPKPYVVQQFIQLEVPEVYRLYAVAGETFGWNARRFPKGGKTSPFVAHAQGARYELESELPEEAKEQAIRALRATRLFDSFGCADLMKDSNGRWLVLEVNTDGLFNHVDRDIDVGNIASDIDDRLAQAFHVWQRKHVQ